MCPCKNIAGSWERAGHRHSTHLAQAKITEAAVKSNSVIGSGLLSEIPLDMMLGSSYKGYGVTLGERSLFHS